MEACPGMAFAEIRTSDGNQHLCWKHFETVRAQVGQSKADRLE